MPDEEGHEPGAMAQQPVILRELNSLATAASAAAIGSSLRPLHGYEAGAGARSFARGAGSRNFCTVDSVSWSAATPMT